MKTAAMGLRWGVPGLLLCLLTAQLVRSERVASLWSAAVLDIQRIQRDLHAQLADALYAVQADPWRPV